MKYLHQRWEYAIVTIRVIQLEGLPQYQETFINFYTHPEKYMVLNKLGFYGWELVGWEGDKHTFKRLLKD